MTCPLRGMRIGGGRLEAAIQRDLDDARGLRGCQNLAETGIGDVAIRVAELRVIEEVERFGAEQKRLTLG